MNQIILKQLAQDLMQEQKKLFVQKTIVEGIKDAILCKKMEVIRQKLERKYVTLYGLQGIVLNIEVNRKDDCFNVAICFGMNPETVITKGIRLTERQKELQKTYSEGYRRCRIHMSNENGAEAIIAANKLQRLKKDIRLIFHESWDIDYADAVNPDFFERSGLITGEYTGTGNEMEMIEDRAERITR